MNHEINIVSDGFKAEELHKLLSAETQGLDLQLVKEPENILGVDTFSLVLGLGAVGTAMLKLLPNIVKGLFTIWEKKIEAKSKLDLANVEAQSKLAMAIVKIKAEGKEIEIPYGSSPEVVNSVLQGIEGKPLKQISLITER